MMVMIEDQVLPRLRRAAGVPTVLVNRVLKTWGLGESQVAETLDDLRAIAKLSGGLPVLPAPATDIAEALGLTHYPVLISNQGIEQ